MRKSTRTSGPGIAELAAVLRAPIEIHAVLAAWAWVATRLPTPYRTCSPLSVSIPDGGRRPVSMLMLMQGDGGQACSEIIPILYSASRPKPSLPSSLPPFPLLSSPLMLGPEGIRRWHDRIPGDAKHGPRRKLTVPCGGQSSFQSLTCMPEGVYICTVCMDEHPLSCLSTL